MTKEHADIILFKQGLFNSRPQAQRAIMAGLVADHLHQRIDKAGEKFPEGEKLYIKDDGQKYVSRGGFKLEKALKVFDIDLTDRLCLDISALTGEFTDVALQSGAKKVYALDVRYNQLAWQLRDNSRVIVMERQNFRYPKPADSTEGLPDLVMTDVSFISLDLIMPPTFDILKDQCDAVCLIKPQFEAGPDHVGKNGIVRDHNIHGVVIKYMIDKALEIGLDILGIDYSPIKGGKGNIEFLIHLRKNLANLSQLLWDGDVKSVINAAANQLQRRKNNVNWIRHSEFCNY